jgi:hypothetical protein
MDKNKKKFVKYGILILCLIFCWYECGPDPENKRKFKRTLGIGLTPDVKDIHYYGDFFAIDFTVLLAFTCDSSTVLRIINENGLKLASSFDTGAPFEFSWWDREAIKTIRPYKNNVKYDDDETHKILWYDKENKKAYYQKFSM